MMKIFTFLLLFSGAVEAKSQLRLELVETNILPADFSKFELAYHFVKTRWLTNGEMPDTSKGGAAWSADSKLNKRAVDSLSKAFINYIPVQLIRIENMRPRILYVQSLLDTPYIKTTVYSMYNNEAALYGQFKIEFGEGSHNKMRDIKNILIIPTSEVKILDYSKAMEIYNRTADKNERNLAVRNKKTATWYLNYYRNLSTSP